MVLMLRLKSFAPWPSQCQLESESPKINVKNGLGQPSFLVGERQSKPQSLANLLIQKLEHLRIKVHIVLGNTVAVALLRFHDKCLGGVADRL